MRAVIQRVKSASVSVGGELVGAVDAGLLVLVGKEEGDTHQDLEWLAGKIAGLRVFPGPDGAMTLSVRDAGGGVLVVSQFTLLASTRKGTRPSWHRAARPDAAEILYEQFKKRLSEILGIPVPSGRFGAMMDVALVNDGPVTLILDSRLRE
jgi:D-tyrosyl-tRNA(Tyr) deacylase